jgi:DNA-binding CsgD family transcriptional regulator
MLNAKKPASGAVADDRGDDALTGLANALLRVTATSCSGADEGQVVLDIERDGYRCVVSRQLHADPIGAPGSDARHLSPREIEIARMVMCGYPNKTIAAILEISAWTVNTHVRRIFGKLGVTSRAAMVGKLLEDRPEMLWRS